MRVAVSRISRFLPVVPRSAPGAIPSGVTVALAVLPRHCVSSVGHDRHGKDSAAPKEEQKATNTIESIKEAQARSRLNDGGDAGSQTCMNEDLTLQSKKGQTPERGDDGDDDSMLQKAKRTIESTAQAVKQKGEQVVRNVMGNEDEAPGPASSHERFTSNEHTKPSEVEYGENISQKMHEMKAQTGKEPL